MSIDVAALRTVPLLAGVSDKDLKKLAGNLRERTYSDGENVVSEGQGGIGFFFILDGKADVTIRGETRATLKQGDHFGELSLLDDSYGRSATVTANGELHTAALTSWQFKPLVREQPDMAWELLVVMAKRLIATEQHYASASS
jgi:CRP/FNR family transcriptional regulator, cyclic AMP receptor protein